MGDPVVKGREQAVSHWEAYGKVSLRAALLARVGGAIIGMVTVSAFEPRFAGWGLLVGVFYGAMPAVTAGPLVGVLFATLAVPYRGKLWTRAVAAAAATASVTAFFAMALGPPHELDRIELTGAIAGVAGAAVTSPYLVRWYIRRAAPA